MSIYFLDVWPYFGPRLGLGWYAGTTRRRTLSSCQDWLCQLLEGLFLLLKIACKARCSGVLVDPLDGFIDCSRSLSKLCLICLLLDGILVESRLELVAIVL